MQMHLNQNTQRKESIKVKINKVSTNFTSVVSDLSQAISHVGSLGGQAVFMKDLLYLLGFHLFHQMDIYVSLRLTSLDTVSSLSCFHGYSVSHPFTGDYISLSWNFATNAYENQQSCFHGYSLSHLFMLLYNDSVLLFIGFRGCAMYNQPIGNHQLQIFLFNALYNIVCYSACVQEPHTQLVVFPWLQCQPLNSIIVPSYSRLILLALEA